MILLMLACKAGPCEEDGGCVLAQDLGGALLSARSGPGGEVWLTGADDGEGPLLLSLAPGAEAWERLDTSAWPEGELWWSWVQEDEAVFVGEEGLILEMDRASGELTPVDGPGEEITFFGVWGATAEHLWAVGLSEGGVGPPALWERQDGAWAASTLDAGEEGQSLFKVHGTAEDEVWFVGSGGRSLSWDGATLQEVPTDTEVDTSNAPLLTVDAGGERPVAVGGQSNGLILEHDGQTWRDLSPDFQAGYNGVCVGADTAWAVGQHGQRAQRVEGAWVPDSELEVAPLTVQDWHGCLVDEDGGVWTVGGRVSSRPLIEGVVAYQGPGEPPAL